MRRRNEGSRAARLTAALACAAVAASAPAADDSYQQRESYRRAVQALEAGRGTEFSRLKASLDGYVLAPYLTYHEARRRVSSLSAEDIRNLRESLDGVPAGERLYRAWMRAQVRAGRWQRYLDNYEPTDDAAARCNYLRALYRSGEREEALDRVRPLWVSPVSQPKTCDPLFKVWIPSGRLTDEVAWERLQAALDAGEAGLASYILRFFGGDAKAARLRYDTHVRPSLLANPSRYPDDARGNGTVAHGLVRLARRDPGRAASLWADYRGARDFNPEAARRVDGAIAVASARAGDDVPVAPGSLSAGDTALVADHLLGNENWNAASDWLSALPGETAADLKWRYWRARLALDLAPGGVSKNGITSETAHAELTVAAGERTYYGFLAAQRLGVASNLNETPPRNDLAARDALRTTPPVARMIELYAVGDLVNARREWNALKETLDDDSLGHLLEIIQDIGWINQAIAGAWQTHQADLLSVRFPVPFFDMYRRHAFTVDLPVSLLLAVSRQESAFDHRATSRAGARGLMQLMPGTARIVARRIRASSPSTRDLFDPELNIRLGSHHLAFLMQRYGGNRALAFAAYNAGEHRVDRWTRAASGSPTDAWIERIPFYETRNYVKNVLAFQHVYAWRAGHRLPMLAEHERLIP